MRVHHSITALAVWLVVSSIGAGAENETPYSRRNPVVDAVKKTQKAIVTIRIPRQGKNDSTGTGIVIGSNHVVTNRHVVGASRQVRVVFWDKSEVNGTIIAEETECDLAIIQFQTSPTKLSPLTPRSTDDLMVGETVIAIGHPYGYQNTVTTGIISAIGREITMPTGVLLRNLIQTSALINPGNSGGPLLNINGELIGINVAVRDGAQGIAFTIPARAVETFLCRHLNANKVAGVAHGLKTESKVAAENDDRQRVVVSQAPAHCQQLRAGDHIIAVGDHSVANRFQIEQVLWSKKPGQQVPLRVNREGQELTVVLTLQGTTPAPTQTQVAVQPQGRPVPRATNYYIP